MKTEDVIIIGGGPAGLAASLYNARADLKPLVIAGSPPGGQLLNTTEVENYPGIRSTQGPELIQKFREHTEAFGTRFIDDMVKEINFDSSPYKLKLANNEDQQTKSIIIATGASAKWLGIESETRLRGKGVSACATCDGFFFKDKVVAVVGGGDTAMEEASFLTRFAKKLYVIHRRDEFRASQIMQKRVLNNEKIEVIWNAEVTEVLGEEKVTGVKLKESAKSEANASIPDELELDGLFIAIGHKPNTGFLKDSGLYMDDKGYLYTSGRYAWEQKNNQDLDIPEDDFDFTYQYVTNKKGVFAAGDLVDHIYRQAATAVGMGVAAALEVEKYLSNLENE